MTGSRPGSKLAGGERLRAFKVKVLEIKKRYLRETAEFRRKLLQERPRESKLRKAKQRVDGPAKEQNVV